MHKFSDLLKSSTAITGKLHLFKMHLKWNNYNVHKFSYLLQKSASNSGKPFLYQPKNCI